MSEPRVGAIGGGSSDEQVQSFAVADNVIALVIRVAPQGATNAPKHYAFSIDGDTINMPASIDYINSIEKSGNQVTIKYNLSEISSIYWSPVYEL